MTKTIQPRLPAGMRDILPDQMLKRQYVLDTVRSVFERFGFEPLQTPSIELSETLTGKYGEDAERLIFKSWYGDTPNGDLSLRYDLTVPLCRVVGMYPDLPRPFKRYQIAPVWRADRPQKGRYREFYQCDVDIVGSASMLADAEIICVTYEVLRRLGFSDLTIAINNRKLLGGIGQYAGVPDSLLAGLYRSIDKFDKIGLDGVRYELLMAGVPSEITQPLQRAVREALQGKDADMSQYSEDFAKAVRQRVAEALQQDIAPGELQAISVSLVNTLAPNIREVFGSNLTLISEEVVNRLLDLLQISGPVGDVLDGLEQRLSGIPPAAEGIAELRDLFGFLAAMGVPEPVCRLNVAMVRGLEYYTGPIFETTVRKPKAMPSITGGGRYDNLIGLFSPVSHPVTGTSLGIERIIDVMDELDMFPSSQALTIAGVLVTIFNADTVSASLEAASRLRAEGINTTVYFDPANGLREQIGYASAKGIPYVVIVGPDEIAAKMATIRKLGATAKDSQQRTVPLADLADAILSWPG